MGPVGYPIDPRLQLENGPITRLTDDDESLVGA